MTDDINTLISVLENPVFQSILNIQDSLRKLKKQVHLHPSILPEDFDITPAGDLVINLPPTEDNSPYQNGLEDDRPEDVGDETQEEADGDFGESEGASHLTTETASTMVADKAPTTSAVLYDEDFKKIIDDAAEGREISMIQLFS